MYTRMLLLPDSNRIKTIIAIFALFIGSANALELGQIKIDSYLNEPLSASFIIDHIDADSLGEILFSIADQDAYTSIGLIRPPLLRKLKFKISAGEGNKHTVNISSQLRVKEPILDVFVKVTQKESSLTRLYTLILDPREISGSNQLVRHNKNNNRASTSVLDDRGPVKTPAASISPDKRVYVGNDSISIIAQNSSLHEKYSVYQIMRAYYLINTSSFNRGNINYLLSGSSLIIPDESLISEVTRAQAINFVYSASENHPFKTKSKVKKTISSPVKKSTIQFSKKLNVKANEPEVSKILYNTNLETTDATTSLQLHIQDDVIIWRTMTDEIKSLSSIVQTQNNVVKLHGDVLNVMNNNLDEKNQQFEQLNIRLKALETPSLVIKENQDIEVSAASGVLKSQNRLIQEHDKAIKGVNDKLSLELVEITRIQRRLEALEQRKVSAIVESVPLPVNQQLPGIIEGKPTVAITTGSYRASQLFVYFLLVLAVLVLVGREFIWRKRIKSTTPGNNPLPDTLLQNENTQESIDDLKETVETKNQHIEQKNAETTINKAEEKSSVSLQVTNQEFENTISSAPEHKLNSDTYNQPSDLFQQEDAKMLYTEIDILIAYNLYDEALELIGTARKTMQGNRCLDIRELEVLAYTKNVEKFFPKFEQEKNILSVEFPDEWSKIKGLNDQLTSQAENTKSLLKIQAG